MTFDPEPAIKIAEKMHRSGEYPSIEKVRRALMKKGQGLSPANVTKALKTWRERTGQSVTGSGNVRSDNERQGKGVGHTARPLRSSKRAKTAATGTRRAPPESAEATFRDELTRLSDQAKIVTERLALVEERLLVLEADDGRLWDRVLIARRQRSADFWYQVMDVVAEILKQHGDRNLTQYDILELIPDNVIQEARAIAERVDYDTLCKRMSVRFPR